MTKLLQATLISIILECTTSFTFRSVPSGQPSGQTTGILSLRVDSGCRSISVCNSCLLQTSRNIPTTHGRLYQLHQLNDPSWFRDNVNPIPHDGFDEFSDLGGSEISGSRENKESVLSQNQNQNQPPGLTTPPQPSSSADILGPAAIRTSLLQVLQLDSANPSDIELFDRLLTTLEIEDLASFLPPNTPMASLKMTIHLAHAKRAAAERSHELQLAQARTFASESPQAPARPDFSARLLASTLGYDGTAMGQGLARRVVSAAEYLACFQESCVSVGCLSSADQGRELLRLLSGPAEAYMRQELPMDPTYGPDWRAKVECVRDGARRRTGARQRQQQRPTGAARRT